MERKLKVGILGGTGMVGQRFITLLANHPWFDVVSLAASERSAGKTYFEAVGDRWNMATPIPDAVGKIVVQNVMEIDRICDQVDMVFCAVDMNKDEIKELEDSYAKAETPVVSNNGAHRFTPDVPMVIPEINPEHMAIIDQQRVRLGTKRGFVAVKPNCSIQSYVPPIHALREFGPTRISVCTYQAISGAGKTFRDWPEMIDNVIPFIKGEDEKSEVEPLKIWGKIENGAIVKATEPVISAQCIRVPATDGHLAAVSVEFARKPGKQEILDRWAAFKGRPQQLNLPMAPVQFLKYFEEENRPQTNLDRDYDKGMGITIGRLREDALFDYKFVALSHNTVRGAAGGGVLSAELLVAEGYITAK